jgi:hypothetical protein
VLTLSGALRSGQLEKFVAQEESRGIGPVALSELDAGIAAVIKGQLSEDRTSRSSSDGGSTGKRNSPR